jgi:ribonucleoside-diphosphate reductase beta chain
MALTDPAFDDALGHRAIGFGAAAEARGLNTSPLAKASPSAGKVTQPKNILDPGFDLTLRPMRYPQFYDMYRDAIKNTWTVDEIDFSTDLNDLDSKITPAERHLVNRLVAFFATGDSIVANNLVLNLYQHINAPEARMYLSRQLYEEALHVQFYLTLLDNYIPDMAAREAAFAAVENIPSISRRLTSVSST